MATGVKVSLAPMLSVRGGAKALEFYQAALGARVVFRLDSESGDVVARLAMDEAEFWVADESPEHGNFSPETVGGATARMVLVVEHPDVLFARAVAAGARVVHPGEEQPYGWRVGRVADPIGHHWEIGREQ
jgi:PhnB protein